MTTTDLTVAEQRIRTAHTTGTPVDPADAHAVLVELQNTRRQGERDRGEIARLNDHRSDLATNWQTDRERANSAETRLALLNEDLATEISRYERDLAAQMEVYKRYEDATPGHNPNTGRDHQIEALHAAATITAITRTLTTLKALADGVAPAAKGDPKNLALRIQAVLRLISPDHITPIGARQIRAAIDDEIGAIVAPEGTNHT